MSFSKAKIQRFNDIKDCTPSPAKYNVLTQEKIKLGTISQSGRYVKKTGTTPPSSEAGSVHSTPCFQTPTVPIKKKKLLRISFKNTSSIEAEELKERIVECRNKDVYIKDLTDQIEEMTGRLNRLLREKTDIENSFSSLKERNNEERRQRAEQYEGIKKNVSGVNEELREIRREHEDLKSQNFVGMSKLLAYVGKIQELYNKSVEESRVQLLKKEEEIQVLKKREEEICQKHSVEIDEYRKELEEGYAKIRLLEENFREVNVLSDIEIKQKCEQVEAVWKDILENKEKEHEEILKECQAISEYNIIQCEVEKNQIKKQLEEEVNELKTEKHAYMLSINTFQDTIEILKKRLIDSDRDVEQLKEELEKCEEKILYYERKCTELSTQLSETQIANEELEMQYESTSKLMQNQVRDLEKKLLAKVEKLKEESIHLGKDKELLNEILEQYHEQQVLVAAAKEAIVQSESAIQSLEVELELYKEETEEAAEIRKKYIEKSGKYDELAQQFEQVLQQLDEEKKKTQDLEQLIGPYQEQLESYQNELKLLSKEKDKIGDEVHELGTKYAQILGHQNPSQKIKHLMDLKMKSTELFQKNVDLESTNYKLNKLVEKLRKENEELKRTGKKMKKGCEEKENLPSPKCLKGMQSQAPLKDIN